MTFETSNKFDENRWTNHIIQEIRNQVSQVKFDDTKPSLAVLTQ